MLKNVPWLGFSPLRHFERDPYVRESGVSACQGSFHPFRMNVSHAFATWQSSHAFSQLVAGRIGCLAQRSMDVLALLTVQNRAVDRSEEAQSLRDKKDVCTSFGVSSQCYNERRQLCERAASSRHRVLAALTQWLVGTLRAARQRGDDAGLLLRRADQSFRGRSCSAPAWLSRSRAHACVSRTRVASCTHRRSITSSQWCSSRWLQRSTAVEKEAQLQKE